MKLRIRGNTIRLRLKRGEVDQIASGGSVVEQTRFPDAMLTYRLDVSDDGAFSATFSDGNLAVRVPSAEVSRWAETDQVSLFADLKLEGGDTLSLLVEKDFACLAPGDHRVHEDDTDTFAHPDAQSGKGC